jgi:hypothetical protein
MIKEAQLSKTAPDKDAFQRPDLSLILMSILPQLLLTFMGRNLSQFAFSSAGHFGVSL